MTEGKMGFRGFLRLLLRQSYSNYYFLLSGACLISAGVLLAYPTVVFIMRTHRAPSPGDSFLILNLLVELALLVPGLVNGVAAWILWRERKSDQLPGRGWVIAASLLNVSMLPLLYGHAQGADLHCIWAAQAVGFVGLIIFSRVGGQPWGSLRWRQAAS